MASPPLSPISVASLARTVASLARAVAPVALAALLGGAAPGVASDALVSNSGAQPDAGIEREAASGPETVVLLHGLGRTDRSMRPLERRLDAAGFRVVNLGYPSLEEEPETLVAQLRVRIRDCCADAPRVHFVTHSLGGSLVRAALAEPAPDDPGRHTLDGDAVGRVVMLAPPNQGSELVDALRKLELFEWMLGPTAERLGTGEDSLPKHLPPPTYEVGVIAGNVGISPLGAVLLEGASDGTVSVESTRLPGMTDFLIVPHSHTFIMQSETVAEQVVEFLRHGRFRHDDVPSP